MLVSRLRTRWTVLRTAFLSHLSAAGNTIHFQVRRPSLAIWAVLSLLLLAAGTPAEEPDPEIASLEKTLKAASVPTKGTALVKYLRFQTISREDQSKYKRLVQQLGNDAFFKRQAASKALLTAGRPALPFLRTAVHHRDLEIRRRARICLRQIDCESTRAPLGSVIRLIGLKNPPGATKALLEYLPCANEDTLEDAVLAALTRVGFHEDRVDPVLLTALTDQNPLWRMAAAHVVGKAPQADERARVRPLLKDSHLDVRYHAAISLTTAGHKEAIPTLFSLLENAPNSLAWQVEDLLYRIAGDKGPSESVGEGGLAHRQACVQQWKRWWDKEKSTVNLARLQDFRPVRGVTVVCDYDGGRVFELGRSGKVRWEVAGLQGPNDVQMLPGRRMLIAERNGHKVTERNLKGKVLWEHKASNNPIGCQRLSNGHTLVVTWSELYEVTATNEVVQKHTHRSGFRHAVQLKNQHVVYITSRGEVVELDSRWKTIRTIKLSSHAHGAGYWASIDPLPGGRFLIALGGAGKVLEIDAKGKVVWEHSQRSPVFATRLRNGNTLISSFDGRYLVEVTRKGDEIQKRSFKGRPFVVRRY